MDISGFNIASKKETEEWQIFAWLKYINIIVENGYKKERERVIFRELLNCYIFGGN